MCAIVVRKGDEVIADEVVEFTYSDGTLVLKKLFSPEIRVENVRSFQWSERDDTLRILS
jgi:altronate dehydratase